jgi:DNA-binding protein
MADEKQDNIVFVGAKSVRTYSESVDMQFNEKGSNTVILKSRGKFILSAINVAQFVVRRSEGKLKIADIKIGSEKYKAKDLDKEIYVSSIDITISK